MNKLISIGELLIDFTANQTGPLKDSVSFAKNPGGAPANVAVCAQRLGAHSIFLTKVATDPFGDFLIETLDHAHVETKYILRSPDYETALAFVSLKADGERDFTFYRRNASDLFMKPEEIPEAIFEPGDILHFGSVDLVDYPVRKAHQKAIEYAHRHHCLVSFDPNLRFGLWPDRQALKETVNTFIDEAHIVKVSDDELEFISGINDRLAAVKQLFRGHVRLVIITEGSRGATIYASAHDPIHVDGFKVNGIDMTGAGDAFVGSFLFQLLKNGITEKTLLTHFTDYEDYLRYSNKVAALVCTRHGAISAMPTQEEVEKDL